MLDIVVYGPGCARCVETERVVREAVAELGMAANVRKLNDPARMATAGILLTPAVTVNGLLKVAGRIPRPEEVRAWLGAAATPAEH